MRVKDSEHGLSHIIHINNGGECEMMGVKHEGRLNK